MISRAVLPAPRAAPAASSGQRSAVRPRPARALSHPCAAWARASSFSALRRPLRSQPEGAESAPSAESAPAAEAAPAEAAGQPKEAPPLGSASDEENEMELSEVEWTSDADWAASAGYSRDGMVRAACRVACSQLGSPAYRVAGCLAGTAGL